MWPTATTCPIATCRAQACKQNKRLPATEPQTVTRPRDPLHNSLRSVIGRTRAVSCVVFLANSPAIGCKRRLAARSDPTATASPELCRVSLAVYAWGSSRGSSSRPPRGVAPRFLAPENRCARVANPGENNAPAAPWRAFPPNGFCALTSPCTGRQSWGFLGSKNFTLHRKLG